MSQETSCPYCGHHNPADTMFCEACSRVLDDPETLADQIRTTYLDQENILVTETSAFLHGKTYSISEIEEVDILERKKDRRGWGLGMIFFGIGTIIEGLFDRELAFSLICGVPLLIAGAILYAITSPGTEEMVSTLRITTEDGTDHSLGLKDQAEAEVIKDAILQSCFDHRGKAS